MINSETFKYLSTVAKNFNEEKDIETLENMENVYNEGLCFIAFIGQFSAGKSSLLNNIIGKQILPTGRLETTPLLSYIRYGEKESLRVHYFNGDCKTFSLESVKELIQSSEKINYDELSYLEIFVNTEYLKDGLILLDTPGINTLIARHEALLSTSMALASGIFYVSANAPSDIDRKELELFKKQAFDVSFIRTHCDEIKDSEESLEEILVKEDKFFEEYNISRENRFYVSNIEDSKYYSNIDGIKNKIRHLGEHSKEYMLNAYSKQLKVIAQRYLKALETRSSILLDLKNNNDIQLNKRLGKINDNIYFINKQIETRKAKLKTDIDCAIEKINSGFDSNINKFVSESAKRIIDDKTAVSQQHISNLLKEEYKRVCLKVHHYINSNIAQIIDCINEKFEIEDVDFDQDELPEKTSLDDISVEQDIDIQKIRSNLQFIKNNLVNIDDDLKKNYSQEELAELNNDLVLAEQNIKNAKAEFENLPAYEPQMVEIQKADTSGSEMGKKIGNIIDWALLLLPGETIAKGLGKVIGGLEKFAKYVKKADTIKDAIYAVKNILPGYATARRIKMANDVLNGAQVLKNKAAEAGLLDYFTVEYWAGKVGAIFDKPPVFDEDLEYKKEYEATKQNYLNKITIANNEAYEKKCKLKLFKNEQEKAEAKRKMELETLREAEEKLAREEQKIKRRASEQARKQWLENCANQFVELTAKQIKHTVKEYIDDIPIRLENYSDKRTMRLQEALEASKNEYDKIKNTPEDKVEEELIQITQSLEDLRKIDNEIN